MKHISLGGLDVSRIGLGTMAMSGYYLDPDSSDAESIRTIQRALELGVTHIDTAEIYGPYANEELVGRALKGRRDHVAVATKFGLVSHAGDGPGVLDSSPANIRTAIEGSLKRLGTGARPPHGRRRARGIVQGPGSRTPEIGRTRKRGRRRC
jgi:aryl-alcohol dehydrogenase-like predicted oxidoreductase